VNRVRQSLTYSLIQQERLETMSQLSVNRRSGYTLIELVASMLAATALIAGLASAMLISSAAFNADNGSSAQRALAADVQADLMADLQHAISFSERTANAVTFTVPDRTGDSSPETIRYAWSGTPGDPLTYAFNGGTAVTLTDNVYKFDLTYLTRVPSLGTSPALYLKLDESSGITAADSSLSGNDGTLLGGPVWQPSGGTIAGALLFDGSNDFVEIPHANDFLLDDGTIDFWFNADAVTDKVKQGLFSKNSQDRDDGGQIEIYLDGTKLKVILESTSADNKLQYDGISAGQWYHVELVFGTAGLSLILDNQVVDQDEYSGGLGTTSGGSGNTEPIAIGGRTNNANDGTTVGIGEFFAGLIDDVTVYNSGSCAPTDLVAFHDDAPGGGFNDAKIQVYDFDLGTIDYWCAQYFMPTLPAGATTWTLSRIELRAKSDKDTDGVMSIQIRTADASQKPTGTVLEEVTLYETELPNKDAWVNIPFSSLQGLSVSQGLCIVIKYVSGGGTVGKFKYEEDGSPMTANTHFMTSTNAGASWSNPVDNQDLRFYVHGTAD
jgi:type II secretory pathway pseudopilin PulG